MRAGYVFKSLEQRFDEKVERRAEDGCWEWMGFVDKKGYGRIRVGGRDGTVAYAHRVSYERFVGSIPDGLQIDHLCRVRHCVNPAHMELVTSRENTLRGRSPNIVVHLRRLAGEWQ